MDTNVGALRILSLRVFRWLMPLPVVFAGSNACFCRAVANGLSILFSLIFYCPWNVNTCSVVRAFALSTLSSEALLPEMILLQLCANV